MAWITVAGVDEVPAGGFIQADAGSVYILVCNVNGEFFAIEDFCTHDGISMMGGCLDGEQLICPLHGARFSLRTGAALSPPAYEAAHIYPVRIQGRNVEVDVPDMP